MNELWKKIEKEINRKYTKFLEIIENEVGINGFITDTLDMDIGDFDILSIFKNPEQLTTHVTEYIKNRYPSIYNKLYNTDDISDLIIIEISSSEDYYITVIIPIVTNEIYGSYIDEIHEIIRVLKTLRYDIVSEQELSHYVGKLDELINYFSTLSNSNFFDDSKSKEIVAKLKESLEVVIKIVTNEFDEFLGD